MTRRLFYPNTQKVTNELLLLLFSRAPQDGVQFFENFPLLRAHRHTNSTFKMKMKKIILIFFYGEKGPCGGSRAMEHD